MAMTAVWLKIDEQRVRQALEEVRNKLDTVEGELVLDFSSARRLDPNSLGVMEELVSTAEGKGVKVVLYGVSAGVYKVLKLVNLASRFSFVG